MGVSRRDLLKASGLVALGAAGTRSAASAPPALERRESTERAPKADKPLRILILGGTGFIGPPEVEYALARGHALTLFNRGKSHPERFTQVETLHGDRAVGDYASLKGRDWDVVIDNPTTLPRWVRQAGEVLKGHVSQYVFISTISVYAQNDVPNTDETAAVATTTEPSSEDGTKYYGPLKALSEKEVERIFPGQTAVLRPGLIVGPGDPTDRFTYWPARLNRGGEVLAPGNPTDPVQFIDARDLAEFCIQVCERHVTGTYNCIGPRAPLSVAELLGGVRAVTTSDAHLTWVPTEFLEKQKAEPWSDLPVWVPSTGESAGFASRDIRRALAQGLTFRPLAVTAKDTLDFYNSLPDSRKAKPHAGLSPEREKAVLAAWRATKKT